MFKAVVPNFSGLADWGGGKGWFRGVAGMCVSMRNSICSSGRQVRMHATCTNGAACANNCHMRELSCMRMRSHLPLLQTGSEWAMTQ